VPRPLTVCRAADLPALAAQLRAHPPQSFWWMVGLPNAGKSSVARAMAQATVISIDEIRAQNGWQVLNSVHSALAYDRAEELTAAALARG
jgi:predicted kinase